MVDNLSSQGPINEALPTMDAYRVDRLQKHDPIAFVYDIASDRLGTVRSEGERYPHTAIANRLGIDSSSAGYESSTVRGYYDDYDGEILYYPIMNRGVLQDPPKHYRRRIEKALNAGDAVPYVFE